MSTPENYGSQSWPDPAAPPPPAPPPPAAPSQYDPMPPAGHYPMPPGQYPPPQPPQYGPPPTPGQYPPPTPGQYPPPPGPYPPPPGPYPPQTAEYPTQGQFPPPDGPAGALPPAAAARPKRPALKIIGSIAVALSVICGIAVGKFALGQAAQQVLGDDSGSSSKAAPKNPFEGTPAEAFPQGEAGIVLPAAAEVPGFTKDRVGTALGAVKQAMIAARLDQTMLVKHDVTTLVTLFAPEGQKDVLDLFDKKDFMHFATQIAPGYSLTSDPIRVKGEMTFGARTEDDIRFLEVKTNYVWVYPFKGELKEAGDHLVTIHDEITWLFPADDDVDTGFRGMFIDSTQSYSSNIDCDLAKQSQLALGKPRLVLGGSKDTDQNKVFDPNGSLDLADTC